RARTRRGYIPFILGILAAAIILTGKALSASNYILYIGAALLIAASIWNNLPLKKLNQKANVADENVCPNCKTD
ncbi:MAG: MerC domain-containing protein, partial [Candidatus Zixiibacteriota bacterium]